MVKKTKSGFFRFLTNPKLFLVFLVVISIFMFFFKKLFVLSLIIFISGFIQMMSQKGQLKFNFGHVFFFSIIIANKIGVFEAIILILFAEFYPKLMIADIDLKTLILIPLEILIVFISTLFSYNIYVIGGVLSFFNYLFALIVSKFQGDSIPEIIVEVGLPFFMNIVYFVSISGPLVALLGLVIAV